MTVRSNYRKKVSMKYNITTSFLKSICIYSLKMGLTTLIIWPTSHHTRKAPTLIWIQTLVAQTMRMCKWITRDKIIFHLGSRANSCTLNKTIKALITTITRGRRLMFSKTEGFIVRRIRRGCRVGRWMQTHTTTITFWLRAYPNSLSIIYKPRICQSEIVLRGLIILLRGIKYSKTKAKSNQQSSFPPSQTQLQKVQEPRIIWAICCIRCMQVHLLRFWIRSINW